MTYEGNYGMVNRLRGARVTDKAEAARDIPRSRKRLSPGLASLSLGHQELEFRIAP